MEAEEGKDSFEVVRDFLLGLGERKPGREEVQAIAPALRDIYERLMRVRAVAPSVDLSDRLWELMEMVGLKARPARRTAFWRAASL